MYDERPYGDILRNERERNGYDLHSMSRHLHIRPDILMAIEQSDFDRMPARGYSKNMVRAYARALHLDEQEITDMFLDQAHMHDVGESRRSSSRSYSGSRSSRNRGYSSNLDDSSYSRRRRSANDGYSSSRSLELDSGTSSRSRRRTEYSRTDSRSRSYDRNSQSLPSGRSRSTDRDRQGERGAGFNAGSFLQSLTNRGGRQQTKVGRSFDTIGSNPPYARNNVGGGNAIASMNIPLLLVIVAALIVLIIVVVVVTNGSQQAAQELPTIPISGLTDTSGTDSSSAGSSNDEIITADQVVLPQNAEVVVEVADGNDSWIEIYENGSSNPTVAEVISGPSTQAFDVDKSLMIRTANPEPVTVTVEDEKVDLVSEGDGNYSYTFNFSDYLKKWKKDNGIDDSSSKSKNSSSSKKSTS